MGVGMGDDGALFCFGSHWLRPGLFDREVHARTQRLLGHCEYLV